jgi:hypothetical protein
LKLKCDEPLSNVAFNFNLRRYNKAHCRRTVEPSQEEARGAATATATATATAASAHRTLGDCAVLRAWRERQGLATRPLFSST